jgi:hypothetical protein
MNVLDVVLGLLDDFVLVTIFVSETDLNEKLRAPGEEDLFDEIFAIHSDSFRVNMALLLIELDVFFEG